MKKLPIYLLLFFSIVINAQIVNSNEKTIGEFYNADVNQFTLNAGKVELQFRLRKPSSTLWYRGDSPTKQYTAKKTRMLFLDIGLTNTKSFLNVNDFDFDAVGLKTGLTYQSSFNGIFIDDKGKILVNKLTTWRIGGAIQFDRFKNFDSKTTAISNESPVTINFKGGVNFYLFNPSYFKKGTIIPNFNVQLTPLTYNSGSLQNYMLESSTTTNNNVVFTKNKSFDGKYGILENNSQASFVSFSSPFIFDKKILKTFYFAPIPHISWQTAAGNKPSYNLGLALGFLNKPIKGDEKTEDLKSEKVNGKQIKYRKFNVPSFLSFGIDWNYKGGKGGSPNYFITGSFSLD